MAAKYLLVIIGLLAGAASPIYGILKARGSKRKLGELVLSWTSLIGIMSAFGLYLYEEREQASESHKGAVRFRAQTIAEERWEIVSGAPILGMSILQWGFDEFVGKVNQSELLFETELMIALDQRRIEAQDPTVINFSPTKFETGVTGSWQAEFLAFGVYTDKPTNHGKHEIYPAPFMAAGDDPTFLHSNDFGMMRYDPQQARFQSLNQAKIVCSYIPWNIHGLQKVLPSLDDFSKTILEIRIPKQSANSEFCSKFIIYMWVSGESKPIPLSLICKKIDDNDQLLYSMLGSDIVAYAREAFIQSRLDDPAGDKVIANTVIGRTME